MEYRIELKKWEAKYKNLWGGVNLKNINAYEFEEVVAIFFSIYFNMRVHPTQKSMDHGIDAYIRQNKQYTMLFQIKKYSKNNKVGESVVRDLYGVMASYALEQNGNQPKGMIVTTGDFSPSAISWAQGKNISLINGVTLVKLFHKKGLLNFYLDFDETPTTIYRKAQQVQNEARRRAAAKKYAEQAMLHKQEEMRQDALKHQRALDERKRKIIEAVEKQNQLKIEQQYKEKIEETIRKQYEEKKRLELLNKEIALKETRQQTLEAEARLKELKAQEEKKIAEVQAKQEAALKKEQAIIEKNRLKEEKKIKRQQMEAQRKKVREELRAKRKDRLEARKQAQLRKNKKFKDEYGYTRMWILAFNILEMCAWGCLMVIPLLIAQKLGKSDNDHMYVLAIYIDIALFIHIMWKYIRFKKGNNIYEDRNILMILLKGMLGFLAFTVCIVAYWPLGIIFLILLVINYYILHKIFKKPKSN